MRENHLPTVRQPATCRVDGSSERSRSSAAGFTLIEIMVVVFIMVMAMSITIPAIYKALEKTKVKSFIRQTAATFRAARSDAVAKKIRIDVIINLDAHTLETVSRKTVSSDSVDASGEKEPLHELDTQPDRSFYEEEGENAAQNPYRMAGFKRHDQTKMQEDGSAIITFFPSGSCDGGELFIQGPQENVFFVIAIDPMTGHISVRQERSLYR